jgi:GT2 family glycosyltransferase
MPKVYIILLNWNGKKDTIPCLESLTKVKYPSFETVIVDNGSTDDSVSAIKQSFPDITLLETKKNLGYAGGNNVGIQYALDRKADFILLLNNDTIVDPEILDAFVKQAELHPKAGIFGSWPKRFYEPELLDHLGGKWNLKLGKFDLIGYKEKECRYEGELDYVTGCAIMIRREVIEKIGLLEPDFFLFWEEADFCMRAKRAGFQIHVCPEAKLLHKVSASFIGGAPHSNYFWWRNRFLWIERNCTPKEKRTLYWKVLLPEIAHIYKLRCLKTLQLALLKLFKNELGEREKKLRCYRAATQGFQDYLFRRFGNGPSWIFKK